MAGGSEVVAGGKTGRGWSTGLGRKGGGVVFKGKIGVFFFLNLHLASIRLIRCKMGSS